MNLNQINLIGRVGKTPEIVNHESGLIAKFSLAVSERVTKGSEKVDETEWFNLKAFKKTAEVVQKFVDKGTLLFVSGKLKTRKYTNKEGDEKQYQEVIVNELKILTPKSERAHQPEPNNDPGNESERPEPMAPEDDLPF